MESNQLVAAWVIHGALAEGQIIVNDNERDTSPPGVTGDMVESSRITSTLAFA